MRAIILAGLLLFMAAPVLAANLDTKSGKEVAAKEAYELSEKCAKSAAEFVQEKYKDWGGTVTDYTNHYNRKLNKCFVNVTFIYGFARAGETDKGLWDVNENKRYGEFDDGLFHRDSPDICEMLGTPCKSKSEWDAMAKPYMDE